MYASHVLCMHSERHFKPSGEVCLYANHSGCRPCRCLASRCLKIAGPKISKLGTQAAAAAPNTFPTSLAPEQPPGRFHFNQLKGTAPAAAAAGHRNPIQDHIGTVSGMAAPAAAGVVAPSGGIVVQQPNGARVLVHSEKARV